MKKTVLLILLCTAVQKVLGEHIFVPSGKTWHQAQAYCRAKHFDLFSVGNQADQDSLKEAARGNWISGWIGLYRENVFSSEWKWSGGETLTYENWGENQPDNDLWSEYFVEIKDNGKWHDQGPLTRRPFYCSTRPVKKTWEEAQEHCRVTHSNLTSPQSLGQVSWVLGKMQSNHITAPMWIGLRFLGDRWLYVDGDSLEYKPWSQVDQDYQCPVWRRCGALTEDGLWENRDCREKLHFLCKSKLQG